MDRRWSSVIVSGSMLLAVSGCASSQSTAPEFRLSSKAAQPALAGSLVQRGKAQLSAGLDAMAIETFRAEIRQSPDSAEAYNGLAIAYDRIGRSDLAQRYFEVALAKAPGEGRYRNNLARFFVRSGQPQLANKLDTENIVNAVHNVPSVESTTVTDIATSALPVTIDTVSVSNISGLIDSAPALDPVAAVLPLPEILAKKGVLSGSIAISTTYAIIPKLSAVAPQPVMPLPTREPVDRNTATVGDLPRDPRRNGARMERMSLGEVMLITQETRLSSPVQKQASANTSFASFDQRLSDWLPQAITLEQRSQSRIKMDNSAIFAAVERAKIDVAVAGIDSNPAINLVESLTEFAYISFDDTASSQL